MRQSHVVLIGSLSLLLLACSSSPGAGSASLADVETDSEAGPLFGGTDGVGGQDAAQDDAPSTVDAIESDAAQADTAATDTAATDTAETDAADGPDAANLAMDACTDCDVSVACTEGPCCDEVSNTFAPAGKACGLAEQKVEYRCVGQALQMNIAIAGCSGSSASCSQLPEHSVWSDWLTVLTCKETETCDEVSDTCVPTGVPECTSGACCDVAKGKFQAQGYKCGSKKAVTQWKCAGATLQKRDGFAGCSGDEAGCSTKPKDYVFAAWADDTVCKKGTVCVEDPPGCKAVPTGPKSLTPCAVGKCWTTPVLGGLCGTSTVNEDYSSGKYNVHQYALTPQPGVNMELALQTTAGGMKPALLIRTTAGVTVYDGVLGLSTAALKITPIASGKDGKPAKVGLKATGTVKLQVYVTGWSVVDGGFSPALSKGVKYALDVFADCPAANPGALLSPPCFDATNKAKGFFLLPKSCPPGLYTRKADDCARGTKLLIDVLYTVAWFWNAAKPSLSPINYLDLNEGSCSTVNHATHDDGTHVDVTAGCATAVSCSDTQPAIELAKLFVDTGQVCGIINNDTAVQKVVNAYFKSKFKFNPWFGTFMRTVSGHTHHFHVRVKKPNGSCN